MSLKIIGAGFGRTGTLSTQFALNQLGYRCYHMKEIMQKENKGHLDFWLKVSESPPETEHDWDHVFANYSATVDYPSSCVWLELVEANPEAKVLLTLHPGGPEAWYKSTTETIYAISKMWEGKFLAFFISPFRKMTRMTSKLIWEQFLHGTMDNKEDAIKRYNEHIEEVKRLIPQDKLLIFSVDQGWEPLCSFLGKEVPKSQFPNVNDKAEMKTMINRMSLFTRLFIMLIAMLSSALVWVYIVN